MREQQSAERALGKGQGASIEDHFRDTGHNVRGQDRGFDLLEVTATVAKLAWPGSGRVAARAPVKFIRRRSIQPGELFGDKLL